MTMPDIPSRLPPEDTERLEKRRRRQSRIYRYGFAVVAVLIAIVAGLIAVLRHRIDETDIFGSEDIFLYGLRSLNVILIAVLLFILFRNVVKLVVERRQGVLGARFKTKLVWAFLLIAILPSIGLFWVVSELIGKNVDSFFNPPMEKLLADAFSIAEDHYEHVKKAITKEAGILAEAASPAASAGDGAALREVLTTAQTLDGVRAAAVYSTSGNQEASWGEGTSLDGVFAKRDFQKVRNGGTVANWKLPERDYLYVLVPLRVGNRTVGALAVGAGIDPGLARRAAMLTTQYETYRQFSLRKRTLKESRVLTYGTVYLLIVFSASWLGLYLARVITQPIEALLEGTHAVATGDLDHRVEVKATDELGLLVNSFNRMTGDLAASRDALDTSRVSLEEANLEIEARRRHIAAVLESIPTGVMSVDAAGRITAANRSAREMLELPADRPVEESAEFLFRRVGARELWDAVRDSVERSSAAPSLQKTLTLALPSRAVQVSASVVPAPAGEGGVILVLEDITELSRAQKMAAWQEVAQRMAHEVKNPLTPIRLSAQRLLKNYSPNDPAYETLVRECVKSIVEEADSLKTLVDEFSMYARLPAPRLTAMNLEACVDSVLALYENHYDELTFEKRVEAGLPPVKGDPEQLKRVLVNLLDNAIEATPNHRGSVKISAAFDGARGLVRLEIRDTGRGVPPEEREKLFLPYFSTKAKGMGLGLAIVSRIVTDHGGRISVSDNQPHGSVFAVEIPA